MTSNQLTVMKEEKRPLQEEPEVPTIPEISDETVPLEKGYYYCVYVMLNFNKEGSVDMKQDQVDV